MKNDFYLARLAHRDQVNSDDEQTLLQKGCTDHRWMLAGEKSRRGSSSASLSPQFTFTTLRLHLWREGKPCPCAVPHSEVIRLPGPFSAGPDATHSPESFHCSSEQQVLSARGIDFHSWCDSTTITSLFKKLPPFCHGFLCTVHVCVCTCTIIESYGGECLPFWGLKSSP